MGIREAVELLALPHRIDQLLVRAADPNCPQYVIDLLEEKLLRQQKLIEEDREERLRRQQKLSEDRRGHHAAG